VAVTRARWLTAGLIGAGALVVAIAALASYVSGHLVVGIVAVTVLMGVLGLGLYSLLRARMFIEGELAALAAQPPGGALYQARRQQALELQGRGVVPDLDVLADATAAQEAERGYIGKYLVATTVLIGLVGTFGGLMETLARVAPLLKGQLAAEGPSGVLSLIGGPLAGLHVTFGTSVVAILVTLALALAQGDVTLHHERLLALLHERTRHVLMPELWPAQESAAERTVRALHELRASVAEALASGAEANATKVAAVVRAEVQRLVEHVGGELREAGRAQAAALEQTSAAMTARLRETAEGAANELRAAATTSREALASTTASLAKTVQESSASARQDVERVARAVEAASAASNEALRAQLASTAESTRLQLEQAIGAATEQARRTQAESAELAARAAAGLDAATTRAAGGLDAAAAALGAVTARAAESFTEATSTAVGALAEVRSGLGASLGEASAALAKAAGDLDGAVRALSPALGELTPQLGALASEVALLAARADLPEQPNAVLDELVRLGEDIERLVAASLPPTPAARDAAEVPVEDAGS
jgi:hypothetical protein